MTKSKGQVYRGRGSRRPPRRSERVPFWRTAGLVIVIVVGLLAIGIFAAAVLVTLDEVQQWAPLLKKPAKLGAGYRRLQIWWRFRPVRPKTSRRLAETRHPNPIGDK